MTRFNIPLSDLDYGLDEEAALLRVVRSKWLSMGPEVEAFEVELASILGVKYAMAVSSGTAALHLAFLGLDLRSGDEVIQPAMNFVAAANLTVAIGATPVFADIRGFDDPTIDPQAIRQAVNPRTKAVVVMHYGGFPCRMAEVVAICQEHGLALIEDACHAIGARYLDTDERPPHGVQAGAIGDFGCFSFYSNKNLAVGEGGLVVTHSTDRADRVRMLRSHGMTTLSWDRHRGHASAYDVIKHGYNYRMDDLRAALGRCQLRKLHANNARRRELLSIYRATLSALPGWTMPFANHLGETAGHLCVMVAPDARTRERVAKALKLACIQTSLHYPCITDFQAFRRFGNAPVERARAFASRAITLPLFPTLKHEQVTEICHQLCAAAMQDTTSEMA